MADGAQSSTDGSARRFLGRQDRKFQGFQSPVTRYGFAVVCVAVALGLSLSSYYFAFNEVGLIGIARVLLVVAVVLAAWYAGTGPAVAAVVLATASYDFTFGAAITINGQSQSILSRLDTNPY
jgi:K+-sensing histidine kinase KdpD